MFIPVKRNWDRDPAEVEAELAKRIVNLEGELNELRAEHEKRRSSNEQNVIDSDDSSDENNSSENKKE